MTTTSREPKKECPPAPVISAPPERELERKLKRNPDDLDAKADVGSDELMDASDPPAAAQPGYFGRSRAIFGLSRRQLLTIARAPQKRTAVAINQQSTVLTPAVNF